MIQKRQIYVLNEQSTFDQAIKNLNEVGNGLLLVVDEENVFIGIITDGDVRRAVLNSDLSLENIINRNPKVLMDDVSKKSAIQYLKKIKRRHLPIVNEDNKLIDIIILDDIEYNLRPNKVIIMAGGLGTRLGELTKDTPKPMLHIGSKPMLEHLIEQFSDHGFTDFIISVNYKADKIKDYFGNGEELGVEITYIEEKTRLGTAGSLSLLNLHEINKPFFVINADVVTSINFAELMDSYEKDNIDALMCIKNMSYHIPYGVIQFDNNNNFISISEKPEEEFFINSGIYILNKDVTQYIQKEVFFDMPDLFLLIKSKGYRVKVFKISDYWKDLGNVNDYRQTNKEFELYDKFKT